MAKAALLLALMLGMAASDDDPEPMGHCMFAVADAVDDLLDGIEGISSAVKTCSAGVSDCATDLLESTSGILEASAASLDVAGCFPDTPDKLECGSNALDISGTSLGIAAKIKELVQGACKPGGGDDRRLEGEPEFKMDKGKSLECAAASAKVLLPITKVGLYFGFEVNHCKAAADAKDAHSMQHSCIDTGLEITAAVASIAGDVIDIIDACGHIDGFNADCGGAITELIEETTDLTNAAIGASVSCGSDKDALRLYQDGTGMMKILQPAPQVQLLPWFLAGLLVLMMPFVYRAGKMRQTRAVPFPEFSLQTEASLE